jgi:putative chitinase
MNQDYAAILRAIAPHGRTAIIAAVAPHLGPSFEKAGITTPLRAAHFLAQAAHECDGFKTLQEYASGRAYEGRQDLGNTQKGDGVRYKGRGIFQLTGRANYRRIGLALSLPLEATPELAADPRVSVLVAVNYWVTRKWRGVNLNSYADADKIEPITRAINGGLNGIDSRREYLARAKRALGVTGA